MKKQLVDNEKFHWGEVIAQHKFGNFLIVEYLEKDSNELLFHSYIQLSHSSKYADTYTSSKSFDEAVLRCLEVKHLRLNSQFTYFACKMLGI